MIFFTPFSPISMATSTGTLYTVWLIFQVHAFTIPCFANSCQQLMYYKYNNAKKVDIILRKYYARSIETLLIGRIINPMKRWLLIALAVICIPITLIGCVPAQTTPVAQAQVNPLQTLQKTVDDLGTWKTTVADPAIAQMKASGVATNYQGQIDSAKATITAQDAKITDLTTRLTTLENWKTTVGTTPTQQTTNPGQGTIPQFTQGTTPTIVTSASGAVISQLNVVSGNLQIASSTTATSQPIWYVQRLINYNTSIMYVRPTVQISQSTQYGWNNVATNVTATTIAINSAQCTMTVSGSATTTIVSIIGNSGTVNANAPATDAYQVSVSPGLGYQTTSISYQPVKGCGTPSGEMYLSPGGYLDLTVQISGFTTSQTAFWTVTPGLSYHP
jgi:hypothetical protein